MNRITSLLIILFFTQLGYSQYIPIDLYNKSMQSEIIVEGEIISQISFLTEDGHIYTRNKLLSRKLLKGTPKEILQIEIITRGGKLAGEIETWTHLLHLNIGDYGVFFLNPDSMHGENAYQVYTSAQGFLKFSKSVKLHANDVLKNYSNIQNEIYDQIKVYTNEEITIIQSEDSQKSENCFVLKINPVIPTRNLSTQLNLSITGSLTETPLYLKEITFDIVYDTVQLEPNIVLSDLIQISNGNELNEMHYSVSIEDVFRDKFRISISAVENQSSYLLLDDFDKELLKVLIDLPLGVELPDLTIDDTQIINSSTFLEIGNYNTVKLSCIQTNFTNTPRSCPIINYFTPRKVAAGVEDSSLNNVPGMITIYGENFGSPSAAYVKPHLSDVLFWDVDLGWFNPAELEYISWSDSIIKVRVPTMSKSGTNYKSPGACTSPIGVTVTDFET